MIRLRASNTTDKWVDVSQIRGTYLGYIEFDGVRYWDLRETLSQEVVGVSFEQPVGSADFVLPSDCRLRQDSIELKAGNVDEAQELKNQMEAR